MTERILKGAQPYQENYQQLYAKKVLAHWLRETEEESGDLCELAPFSWRANYGVHENLEFHELDDPYYFECSEGLYCDTCQKKMDYFQRVKICGKCEKRDSFDPKIDRGEILFVPDITVFHKGTATLLFEIAPKKDSLTGKISAIKKFFKGYSVRIYEVDAEFILRQTGKPAHIKCKQIL